MNQLALSGVSWAGQSPCSSWCGTCPFKGSSPLNILKEGCASANAAIFVLVLDPSVLGCIPLYCNSSEPGEPVLKLGVARQILAGHRGRKEGEARVFLLLPFCPWEHLINSGTFLVPLRLPSPFESSVWPRDGVLTSGLSPCLVIGHFSSAFPWVTSFLHQALCFKYSSDFSSLRRPWLIERVTQSLRSELQKDGPSTYCPIALLHQKAFSYIFIKCSCYFPSLHVRHFFYLWLKVTLQLINGLFCFLVIISWHPTFQTLFYYVPHLKSHLDILRF